jgi:hypothetical protein
MVVDAEREDFSIIATLSKEGRAAARSLNDDG